MTKNRFDLHDSRLATTDENGMRVYLHPEDINGKWKERRITLYWFLIIIYLVLPWIYVDGKQWLLLDLVKREFHIFGNTFYGHDGPFLIFILLGFVFLMAFITSIWGRVWCGWACPQTVFIDAIYRKIERLIEGRSRERVKLDQAPWNIEKIIKRSAKWFLFILVSLHISHSFLGYFVGTHKLFWITMSPPKEHLSLFITMLVITSILLFDFGWFKEQFCIIACPYGRFQSVIMDENSLVISYNKKRGEPRRSKDVPKDKEGDCINCYHCVKACPTGIDIRRGTQLECIACTMCINACDEIMEKLNKPTGLISYSSANELNNKKRKISLRSIIYGLLFIAVIFGFITSLNNRKELRVQFLRGSKMPFSIITNQEQKYIVNHYKVKLNYYGDDSYNLYFKSEVNFQNDLDIIMPISPIQIHNENKEADIFFKFPVSFLNQGSKKINLLIINSKKNLDNEIKSVEVQLVGPYQ